MKNYKSKIQSFRNCPFSFSFPKVTTFGTHLTFEFIISFIGKTGKINYLIKEFTVTDQKGRRASIMPSNQLNPPKNKAVLTVDTNGLLSHSLDLTVNILTEAGDSIDVSYLYQINKPVVLKYVAIANMTNDEKDCFVDHLKKAHEAEFAKSSKKESDQHNFATVIHDFDQYTAAITSELYYLKHNGGKRYKVTDGRLLTPDSNEFCYSFELETELFLSDDAPVSVICTQQTVKGTVIVCDGLQIIVSLESNIGNTVSSAYINVEPWKLLEKLNERIRQITPQDRIAWKLFHEGPGLALGNASTSSIKCGQKKAIEHALNNDITVIWGPPGTGKTYTMAKMAEQFVTMGKTVLIVSHSNISVDNVVKQIYNQFSSNNTLTKALSKGTVLRYGYVRDEELKNNENCVAFNYALKSHPNLNEQREDLLKEKSELKAKLEYKSDIKLAARLKDVEKLLKGIRTSLSPEIHRAVSNAQVVATTVSKIYMDKLFESCEFDVVMFDEVSMAYVPQLLCAATFATEKFICVGDFRQLPPIVQSHKAKEVLEYDKMLMNICYLVIDGMLLSTQEGDYRMATFIDDQHMHSLYENFIREYYKYHFGHVLNVSAAFVDWDVPEGSIGLELLPKMKTDITLQKGNKTLIIDAKYYQNALQHHFGASTFHSANMYQIYTYVKNMDKHQTGNVSGMLLYAHTTETIQPDNDYIIGGNKISVKTLNLNCQFDVIKDQLNEIISSLLTQ